MKVAFVGTYLRMLQVGNGLSDHDLAARSGVDESRLSQILKHPHLMTTNEMVRLALALDTEIEFNLLRQP